MTRAIGFPPQVGLSPVGYALASPVSLTGLAATAILTTGSLVVGTYLIQGEATIQAGAVISVNGIETGLQVLSGTATWVGLGAAQPGSTHSPAAAEFFGVALSGFLVVTVAAVVRLAAYNNSATAATALAATGTETFAATRLTTLKIA